MSISSAAISRNIETVVALPFILAVLFPSECISRCNKSSSSTEKPFSESLSTTVCGRSSKRPVTTALSAPALTISLLTLPPSIAFMPPISMLLPAPVSPVNTLSLSSKAIDAFSITARFSIDNSLSKTPTSLH